MVGFLQEIVQTSLAFFSILIFTRLIGKQQVSQLTYYEYVTGITFGSIAATIATDGRANLWHHMLDLVIFTVLTIGVSYIVLRSRPVRKVLEGEPTVVVHNGKVLEKNLETMRYNLDDLLMQLRGKNIFNIEDVEFAVFEDNGQLSVLLKSQKLPLTPADLNIETNYQGLYSELIMDGVIIHQNLEQNNLTEEWLLEELKKRQVYHVKDVVLAVLDTEGNIYLDLKKDDLQSPRDISDFSKRHGGKK
ncbi:MAG: DUF421 domain-containing protein [Desulfitobacteriaceae bacterium]|nr:DUF421 domain-containing protein [Desulfitobacteriaceae bacterium]